MIDKRLEDEEGGSLASSLIVIERRRGDKLRKNTNYRKNKLWTHDPRNDITTRVDCSLLIVKNYYNILHSRHCYGYSRVHHFTREEK